MAGTVAKETPTASYADKPNLQGTGGNGGDATATLILDDSQNANQSQAIYVSETAYGGSGGGEGDATGGPITLGGLCGSADLSAVISMTNQLADGASTSLNIDLYATSGEGQSSGNCNRHQHRCGRDGRYVCHRPCGQPARRIRPGRIAGDRA